jgi:hypothetical protein
MAMVPTGLTAVDEISGDDEEDAALLRGMAVSARKYITAHEWCPPVAAMYLADGVGDIVALFLVEFTTTIGGTDNRLWVVNGDLPAAYLVVEPGDNAREVLEKYCLLMEDWIQEVLVSGDFKNVFPVAAQRTQENVDLLRRRLEFLRRDIVPQFQDTSIDP